MTQAYIILCVLAGSILPLQAALNAGLARQTTGPLFSTFINFASGILLIIPILLILRVSLPSVQAMADVRWYYWLGGFLGVFFIVVSMNAAPRLGAGLMVAIIVAGQLGASLLFDHYGWLGYDVHTINWGRIAGAAFLIAGAVLVYKY